VIRKALGKAVRLLASARLATLLLALVGVWSMLGSLVPQGAQSSPVVAAWAATNPLVEGVVRLLGLHAAFDSPLLLACVFVLAISTALCAWKRTKLAIVKSRLLLSALPAGDDEPSADHDLEVVCGPSISGDQVLSTASATLSRLGIRAKVRDGRLAAVSPVWSVWGSPVFHWSLLALILIVASGGMFRSAGQIGLAVGQTKPDEPASYGVLSAGPLHGSVAQRRSVRVDAFEVRYESGGVNRGPTPTVTVLDANGDVVKSQRVYPNNTLQTGSLTIYPVDYGLSATISLLDASGTDSGRMTQLIDFSTATTEGTAPAGHLALDDGTGNVAYRVLVSVPLDRAGGGFAARLPADPRARVVVLRSDGSPLLDSVLRPGGQLELPTGGALKLTGIGYYARLQLVDDPSVPVLYAGLVLAMLGLVVATLARQHIIVATIETTPEGVTLRVRMRMWRNFTSGRGEIEEELQRALGPASEEDTA
jgi:cytochrome c biogenesis protein ResB